MLPVLSPKSVSIAQMATTTAPATPKRLSIRANRLAFRCIWLEARFSRGLTRLARNSSKLMRKACWLRSSEMTLGSYLTPERAADSVRSPMPCRAACCRNAASHSSKLPVFSQVAAAAVTYLEGYLWDPPQAKEAFVKAAGIAHKARRRVALTLSDAFCVDRYRTEFLDLIRKGLVDIVFANERELHSLYETSDFDTAVNALRGEAKLAVVTRSEKGCVVVSREAVEAVPAEPVAQVADVTGAGDTVIAAMTLALAAGATASEAAHLANYAGGLVVMKRGTATVSATELRGAIAR